MHILYKNASILLKKDVEEKEKFCQQARHKYEDALLALNEQIIYLNESLFSTMEPISYDDVIQEDLIITHYPLKTIYQFIDEEGVTHGSLHSRTRELKMALYIKENLLDPISDELKQIYEQFDNNYNVFPYVPLYTNKIHVNPHTFEPELTFFTLFVVKRL